MLSRATSLFSPVGIPLWVSCIWLAFLILVGGHQVSAAEYLHYDGRLAAAPPSAPAAVHRAVAAANQLQKKPYRLGGGHRVLYDRGYDCSGTVSYVLHLAGLLRGPLPSKAFRHYGKPGPGRYITLFVRDGHVFMSICGLRLDTSDYGAGRGNGPRWRPTARAFHGYEMRHPHGL